ncbi:MAG: NAD(P)-dependent oxidoreductase [Flavobacteriales bacterium]
MKKVLFIDQLHPSLWNQLTESGFHCVEGYHLDKEEIKEIISGFYGLIIRSRFKIDDSFLENCNHLKFIARGGSGMENIDQKLAQQKGIECINAAEGNRQAVAEHALGMLLNLFNNLKRADQEVRQGHWKRESNRGVELSGKTIGIIGCGNTGSAFGRLLRGFDCKVLSYDKYLNNYGKDNIIESQLETLYEEADILSLHIPLTKETHHLVNDIFLNRFKKPIYLINTSRGQCVDTVALLEAIDNKKVMGACLDVLEIEKISFESLDQTNLFKRLIQSNKLTLSPHIAGWTVESYLKIAQVLFEKIKALENN